MDRRGQTTTMQADTARFDALSTLPATARCEHVACLSACRATDCRDAAVIAALARVTPKWAAKAMRDLAAWGLLDAATTTEAPAPKSGARASQAQRATVAPIVDPDPDRVTAAQADDVRAICEATPWHAISVTLRAHGNRKHVAAWWTLATLAQWGLLRTLPDWTARGRAIDAVPGLRALCAAIDPEAVPAPARSAPLAATDDDSIPF